MADRVELAFREAAASLIPQGASVLVAVSGGGDSIALLHLLDALRARRGLELTVAHLDHGIRRGARTDRSFVERLSRELGLRCVSDRRDVPRLRRRDESPEEAARRVRRAFLLEAAGATGSDRIALGHTLDDQAETILMRLARGSGTTSLAGMVAGDRGPFIRPLLLIERRDLRRYLERHGRTFREDPSNADLRFDRNRVRHRVLPVLAESLNPQVARHLVRAARMIREDAAYLDAVAEAEFELHARRDSDGSLVVEAARLAHSPAPVGRRLARLLLAHAGADGRKVAARHVDALLDLARGPGGRRLDLPGRLSARRERSRILIGPGPPAERDTKA